MRKPYTVSVIINQLKRRSCLSTSQNWFLYKVKAYNCAGFDDASLNCSSWISNSGLRGRRRTYLTIFKRAWSANFKMVWYILLRHLRSELDGRQSFSWSSLRKHHQNQHNCRPLVAYREYFFYNSPCLQGSHTKVVLCCSRKRAIIFACTCHAWLGI
jgi:hypothetical protein